MKRSLVILQILFCCFWVSAQSGYLAHRRSRFQTSDAWTLASVSGLVCWAKPETLSGTNGATQTWADSSGNGFHWGNGESAKLPLLTNSSVNGYAALWFDGSNDWLTNSFGSTKAQSNAVFIVANFISSDGTTAATDGISSTGRHFVGVSSGKLDVYAGSDIITTGAVSVNTWYLITVIFNGNSTQIRTNGVAMQTGTGGTLGVSGLTIGSRYSFDRYPLKGAIAELALYSPAPSPATVSLIESSLKSKFALP